MGTGCGGCGESPSTPLRQVWGKLQVADAIKRRAAEPIDAHALDDDRQVQERVLTMPFEEVVERLGFVEYHGVARFKITSGRTLSIVEDTVLRHGLAGSFQVIQKDGDGNLERESIYTNGVHFVRNGPGKMYVQGMIKGHHLKVRDEAWQPLRVYTRYFGEWLRLEEAGTEVINERSAVRYRFALGAGAGPVEVAGSDGPKTPESLSGTLWVDEKSGVPVKSSLDGVLAVPLKDAAEPAKLTLGLETSVALIEGIEIKPTEFEPTITRHPVDLDPLSFLKGGTRTSTVIGGGRAASDKKAPPK